MRTPKSFIMRKYPIFSIFLFLLLSIHRVFSTVKINKSTYGNCEQKCLPLRTVAMNKHVFAPFFFFFLHMCAVCFNANYFFVFVITGLYPDNVLSASVEG